MVNNRTMTVSLYANICHTPIRNRCVWNMLRRFHFRHSLHTTRVLELEERTSVAWEIPIRVARSFARYTSKLCQIHSRIEISPFPNGKLENTVQNLRSVGNLWWRYSWRNIGTNQRKKSGPFPIVYRFIISQLLRQGMTGQETFKCFKKVPMT